MLVGSLNIPLTLFHFKKGPDMTTYFYGRKDLNMCSVIFSFWVNRESYGQNIDEMHYDITSIPQDHFWSGTKFRPHRYPIQE